MIAMQRQPNLWTCYPTAVSFLTGIPMPELMKAIGHDGSKVVKASQDWMHEAFIYDEMAFALLRKGWALVKISASCVNENGELRTAYPTMQTIMNRLRNLKLNAVVVVQKPGREHALAWVSKDDAFYDPRTGELATAEDSQYPVICFEALVPMQAGFREFL